MADIIDRRGGRPTPPPAPTQLLGVSAQFAAFPVHIDANGIGAFVRQGEDLDRTTYMDGEQFLGAIQGLVRREVRAGMVRAGLRPKDDNVDLPPADFLTECAVPNCSRPQAQALLLGLGQPDGLAVSVPVCAEHVAEVQAASQPVDA